MPDKAAKSLPCLLPLASIQAAAETMPIIANAARIAGSVKASVSCVYSLDGGSGLPAFCGIAITPFRTRLSMILTSSPPESAPSARKPIALLGSVGA